MENQPFLDGPSAHSHKAKPASTNLAVRPHYIETPYSEVMEEPGPGLLLEYWDIVRRHKGTLVLIAFLGLLLALLITLPQTPIYRARTSLEIQNLNENFLNMRDVNPTTNEGVSSPAESDLETQVKILQSESVLEGVIVKLNLAQRASAESALGRLSAWRKALGLAEPLAASTREELLRRVAKNLTIQTEPKTRLVEIFYNSKDPQLAADFANALTTEFIQQNLEARWKTTQQTGEWLTRQMDDVRIKLEKSEDELQSYAHASGLLFTSEKVGTQLVEGNVAEDKLRQLQEELSRAHADRVAKQSVYESASSAPPESLPEVLDDKTLGEYQVRLTDLRRQLAELSSSLTPAHPSVQKVQAQVTTLESALENERANDVQRIRNEYQSARRRENLLSTNYASQASLVSEQAAKVAHYNILKRDVDTNRELYDSLLRNVQEAGMTSALRSTNIRVVDPATPPVRPYKPSFALNMGLGLLAGAFFGMAFVVMRERADQSIKSPGEAALYLDVPELGVIPAANAEGSRLFAYYHDQAGTRGSGLETGGSGLRLKGSVPNNGDSAPKSNGSVKRGILSLELGAPSPESPVPSPEFGASSPQSPAPSPEFGASSPQPLAPSRVELVTSQKPASLLADSFRATSTSILYSGENGDRPRIIALTSASPGEGKTTVSSNLALALAEIGRPVLLIDGDLRQGRLHEVFDVSNAWGLSDLLAGKEPPEVEESRVEGREVLRPAPSPVIPSLGLGTARLPSPQSPAPSPKLGAPSPQPLRLFFPTAYPNLYLLPAGSPAPSISNLLHSPRAVEFLRSLRQQFHTVLIDTPPMLQMPDARVFGRQADAVILVVRSAQTTRESAAAAAQRLTEDGTRVLGTILNEWDPRKASHAGYAHPYRHYQYYEAK